jgi:hypothetical protein
MPGTLEIRIELDRPGFDAVKARLDPGRYDRAIDGAMDEGLTYLQGEVQKGTPVDLGLLRAGEHTEVTGHSVQIIGKVVTAPESSAYALTVEDGRRPGGKMPPVAALLGWVQRHGIAGSYSVKTHRRLGGKARVQDENLRAAWAIARAIQRRGIPGRHMFRDAAIRGKPVVVAIFEKWIRGA